MVSPALVKFAAALCLILQVWGGTGLDRMCFCTCPGEAAVAAPAAQTECKCCDKGPRPEAPVTVMSDDPDGCCIKAPLPDDTFTAQARDQEQDSARFVAFAEIAPDPSAGVPARVAITCPPRACSPPGAIHISTTRLRL